jgi:hypothetical protein
MPTAPVKKSGMVVAREAVVVNVGGRPLEYGRITVTHKRTGERVEIDDTDNQPIDPGELGTPFSFKAGEKVARNHPAVIECPGAFVEEGDWES